MAADKVIFYLGRMAVDDFGEILTLAGNGRGFGAYKIVRGMYECIVTALYMEKNPAEARAFAESSAIMKLNYLKRRFEADPAIRNRFSEEFMQTVEQDAAAAEAKRKQSICSKCRQPVTQEAWTRISLDVMAKAAEPALEVFYPQSSILLGRDRAVAREHVRNRTQAYPKGRRIRVQRDFSRGGAVRRPPRPPPDGSAALDAEHVFQSRSQIPKCRKGSPRSLQSGAASSWWVSI
jgi:hypothetical protein